ncbi:sulfate adenylyltransferase subunit 1 [Lacihabitans lacunae]|uniref:sulfate adenylyltransferase n=1 Tax=Lacihabitans lacunae TaxID=1028214 RepID=A0ABV7YRJ7_9BACT
MDILKIATAGSVDDGKSTLIGRLLYETKSITKDKIEALEMASKRKGLDFTDLSLLTDGLIAEREQGITIDVAHIYFNTPTRKYIIADTPGHLEYTRNMITGASNASVSIILIDSRNGISEQTKRHYYISQLLRIENVIVAVNKMDLVDYSEEKYNAIKTEFENTVGKAGFEGQKITFIPLSSLYGDNMTIKSDKTPWYEGDALLGILENIESKVARFSAENIPARLGVQYVIRPKTEAYHDFRGYSGRISSGEFKVGDEIIVLPSRKTSKIKTIERFEEKLETAQAGFSVNITLEDDIDISRGNMLAKITNIPDSVKEITARICWMDTTSLTAGKTMLLQHGVNKQKAKILSIESVLDITILEEAPERNDIQLNEIGEVKIKLAGEIFADKYVDNPANGAFILIDPMTNNTSGLGFIL